MKTGIAGVEPPVGPEHAQVVDVQVIRVFGGAHQRQLLGGEAELLQVLGGQPAPRDLAVGRDFVHRVVNDYRHVEAGHRVRLVDQHQCVAVGQSAQVVMLAGGAVWGGIAPAPYHLAVPIQLADGLVVQPIAGGGERVRLFRGSQLHQHAAAGAAGQRRVQQHGGKAGVVPAAHFVAVHVDEAGLAVRTAEHDVAVPGLLWVVTGHAGGVDAGRAMRSGGQHQPGHCGQPAAPYRYGVKERRYGRHDVALPMVTDKDRPAQKS
ncbi:MAG: hypothetical protein OZX49_01725 [Immundisolibacter sp.]|nr:hypothetical protein [Immundisolibacter sp.]